MILKKTNSLVLVTGSSGFVGRHLCEAFYQKDINFVPVVRKQVNEHLFENQVVIANIDEGTDWSVALAGVDCIVHLAAHVHQMDKASQGNPDAYFKLNFSSTISLAKQAAKAGVKRFVFMSSISVYGVHEAENLIDENTNCNPQSHYAYSKYQAELTLLELGSEEGMEIVIIRPPLVYGPRNKGNFLKLLDLVKIGLPLPFGDVTNKRSFVFVDNLVDLVVRVIDHPKAAGQVFLVSDDHDVSTTTLVKAISSALGKKAKLIPAPLFFLKAIFYLIGKPGLSQRLLGCLCLDISKTKELLNWKPPVSFEDGISRTAKSFLNK